GRLVPYRGPFTLPGFDEEEAGETRDDHARVVAGLAASPAAMLLASASHDRTIRFWERFRENRGVRQEVDAHDDWVWCVAFHPGGRLLASGSEDRTVKLWETATGDELATLEGHDHAVRAVAFTPDGRSLVSAGWDGTTVVWDLASRV